MSMVSEQYAKVLFELASERDCVKDVQKDLDFIRTVMDEVGEFRKIWLHPVMSAEIKKDILQPVLKESINALSWDFVRLLIDRGREGFLDQIRLSFASLIQKAQGITQVEVHTARTLDEGHRESLQRALARQYGQVSIEEIHDPSLLAGVVVRVGDVKIDGSLRRRLDALEAILSEGGA